MNLLIIKYKDKYVRHKDGQYIFCGMDKASVFPMTDLEDVKDHILNLRRNGFSEATIAKLIVEEAPFNIDDRINHNES